MMSIDESLKEELAHSEKLNLEPWFVKEAQIIIRAL